MAVKEGDRVLLPDYGGSKVRTEIEFGLSCALPLLMPLLWRLWCARRSSLTRRSSLSSGELWLCNAASAHFVVLWHSDEDILGVLKD
jgi:hypothetical protein